MFNRRIGIIPSLLIAALGAFGMRTRVIPTAENQVPEPKSTRSAARPLNWWRMKNPAHGKRAMDAKAWAKRRAKKQARRRRAKRRAS